MHIAILGTGISGLATGWFLKQRFGNDIRLSFFEKSRRVGGWIQSVQCDDFIFELGPRSLRTKGAGSHSIDLVEALGLQSEVVAADPAAKRRYLWTEGALQELPSGPLGLFSSSLGRSILTAALGEPFRKKGIFEDESIYDFISRRLSTKIAESLFDPMVSGIYAGDIRKLSLRSCFPLLHDWEQEGGSLIKGAFKKGKKLQASSEWGRQLQRQPIFTFRRGMETLVQALHEQLEADWYLGDAVTGIENGIVHSAKRSLEADWVVSCLPAPVLGDLLGLDSLKVFPMASLTVVCLGYNEDCLEKPGFGYLIPSKEKENLLGVVFDSSAFPEQNLSEGQTRLTAMIGGETRPELAHLSGEECLSIVKDALKRHLNIDREPDFVQLKRVQQAIPQYQVGHGKNIAAVRHELEERDPRLILSGNSFDGVAVNDCVANAKMLAERLRPVVS